MSAGPDELYLREFKEASELIPDPLQAFFEKAQAVVEVLKSQKGASIVSVFRKGSTGTDQTYKQCHTTAGEASPMLGITDRSITWETQEIIQSSALQG